MTVAVQQRQNVFDIALQHLGSPEAAFAVAEKLGCAITDELTAGVEIELFESEILDRRMVEHYRKNGIVPATAMVEPGIDLMEIEYNFIVI
jgi:hypothetical protein